MSTVQDNLHNRSRFLVLHDSSVVLEKRGLFRDICVALTNCGADVHVIEVRSAGEACEHSSNVAIGADYHAILVAGTRATLAGVHAGVPNGEIPVGVLPVSSCETLGKTLGLRGKAHRMAHLLTTAPVVTFPGMYFAGTPVSVMAGFGFDQDILCRLSRYFCPAGTRSRFGAALAPKFLKPVERFDVIVDGLNYRSCFAFVMRTAGFANLVDIPFDTGSASAPLTAILFEADDRTALFDVLVAAKLGRLFKDESVSVRACHQIEVSGIRNLAIDLDGQRTVETVSTQSSLHVLADGTSRNVIAATEVAEQIQARTTIPTNRPAYLAQSSNANGHFVQA